MRPPKFPPTAAPPVAPITHQVRFRPKASRLQRSGDGFGAGGGTPTSGCSPDEDDEDIYSGGIATGLPERRAVWLGPGCGSTRALDVGWTLEADAGCWGD